MSTTNTSYSSGPSIPTILGGMFCVLVVAIVVLVIFAPTGTDVGAIVTALLGAFAALVPSLITLVKIRTVEQRQEDDAAKLDYLTNGGMDAKNRAAIADVLPEEFIRPEYREEQLDADRAHREAGPATPGKQLKGAEE